MTQKTHSQVQTVTEPLVNLALVKFGVSVYVNAVYAHATVSFANRFSDCLYTASTVFARVVPVTAPPVAADRVILSAEFSAAPLSENFRG